MCSYFKCLKSHKFVNKKGKNFELLTNYVLLLTNKEWIGQKTWELNVKIIVFLTFKQEVYENF